MTQCLSHCSQVGWGRSVPPCSMGSCQIFWTLLEVKPTLSSRVSLIFCTFENHLSCDKTKHLLLRFPPLPSFSFSSPSEPSSLKDCSLAQKTTAAQLKEESLFTARNSCGQGWETMSEFVKEGLWKQWCWDWDNNLLFWVYFTIRIFRDLE